MFLRIAAVVLFLAALLPAQERAATVVLNDGQVLEGTVLEIQLGSMRMRVGDEVFTIATADVQSCRFAEPPASGADGEAQGEAQGGAQEPASNAQGQQPAPAAPQGEGAPAPAPAGEVAAPPRAGETAPSAAAPRTQPTNRPVPAKPRAAVADQPAVKRPRSHAAARLEAIGEVYPWLVPSEPTQWISIGLLVFACLSLVVHLSVCVVGAESASFGRSMALALWYELTGLLQFALVPPVHVATFSMLIGNTALALFWLRQLFAVSRGGAVVAFAVQLGFAVLGYGVLELVTSLLASIDPVPA